MNNLSHILEIRTLSEKPSCIKWQATAAECKELAQRLKVQQVRHFCVQITAKNADLITIKGHITAEVIQACVVTGAPVGQMIDDTFEEFFCEKSKHKNEIDIDMDTPDVTPVEGGKIDLGELATQYLILGLDPYPRQKEATFSDKVEDDSRPNPFSVLKKLKH